MSELTRSLFRRFWNIISAVSVRAKILGMALGLVLLLDEGTKTTCLTDPIGGSASFYETKVKLVKV